ncbi:MULTISPECIES: MgtC/SapB family protein [Carboxydocella]|uniref:Putative Mg2+ transporter-C (MgtC) family protein n=2 Tax=Carboxydocella TaxID=178898 RepID=A0A1T4LST9_9FIRM|nr:MULTISPECIES: MgtC/SapB family protein [Carboxydocella]AVX20596.1 putative Mg2+ transporter-C (MgtC) family protein [Carboxydocella thermautotrophica]AVX31018.1 putative Mg2+ transporter-C (MgtC) family protein [Carboxydocella thermautotrophica]SJZ57686.1 putative Mg2+ transporter-C (MgtC) family protein [Carboxydocella sporoproducens DSM 16521]GAW27918.1 Transporter MgtC/SapB family [Carboxydocella sp. ULO1]GAW31523.1 Transporter MgtC/SapB family [Carboxydocella sp. JDF658]
MSLGYFDITLRMVVALIAGAILGYERTKAGKPAGIRTHALVCISSAMLTIISAYGLAEEFQGRNTDPLRLAAQIVSGIGFLGAGVIWKQGFGEIRGLTTATNIWAAAGLGIAAGLGQYYLIFITIVLLRIALKIAYILQKLGIIKYEDNNNKERSQKDDSGV